MTAIHLNRSKRINAGHLWVFSNEITENIRDLQPGTIVEIYDRTGAFLGVGYLNPRSLIAARILSREKVGIGADFFRGRIGEALRLRERLLPGSDCGRLVFSEGDYLPGLIVDRFGDCIVVQSLTYGIESMLETVIDVLDGLIRPATIVLRNDSRIRSLEGLSLYKRVVKGTTDVLPLIHENGLVFEVDPMSGQKTGFFLDQRDNRAALRKFVRAGRGLDLFSYSGAWGLGLAAQGIEMTLVDDSERAVEQAGRNAELNGLKSSINFVKDDVFKYLDSGPASAERSYDVVVLDPPAFVKSASKLKEAVRAYRRLNAACMRLIRPGGILATSSCSYHLGRELFIEMLISACRDAGRQVRLIELRSQASDHPVLLSMPETEYLKCAFLVVD